ncbi:hypothetical protein QBD01_002365 [Ochrobactrum sp. 19YEA23]|jgi:hypothetical protein|uniref:four-helix bundle copper-binding protein n=1 Tax=unclassified Ochrobactrum TaxID=239106 RepID=UPI0009927D48|nr:four-helix bundle copper-binding protein [Ochrobactrum sp. Kaboul]MBA8821439.1 hypothetical protein [Ochrobactrum sp. P6BSIII]MDH7786344.1 hypothetical protein [Ochrobactrum sp. 19YEA23]OOL15995.1 ferredoxin [Ochrobactrum sp. P6BS-III]
MNSTEMKACIEACLACYQTCLGMASTHCLEEGGEHVEPVHFRTMLACAEICRTCAHIMLLRTPLHQAVCKACAEICEACSKSCEDLDGMDECVAACDLCAATCREMAA